MKSNNKYITTLHSEINPAQEESVQCYWKKYNISGDLQKNEGELLSELVVTRRENLNHSSSSVLHSHSFYELTHYNNDCGIEYLVGANRYCLQKGDIIITPPGVLHCTLFPESMTDHCNRDVIWLSTEFTEFIERRIPDEALSEWNRPYLMRTSGTKWEFLSELFHTGISESELQEFRWDNVVVGNTMILLAYMCRAALDSQSISIMPEKMELLENIIRYIDANLEKKISLSDTAKHFFVSESTLTRLFRKKMGISFYQYVTRRRLATAEALIIEGVPIETVGKEVGFADYVTFYRAFKLEYGISPREFKNRKKSYIPQQ